MLPFKRDKVDVSKLSPEEKRIFSKYGTTPTNMGKFLAHKGVKKWQERKYFDSGDYALSKAGRAPQSIVGTAIPNPENIPHASSSANSHNNGQKIISISPTNSTNPVKESGLANDENTKVPLDYEQPGSGEETIVDKTTETTEGETIGQGLANPMNKESGRANDENINVPPGSVKETVVDKMTESAKEETTGQGLAR